MTFDPQVKPLIQDSLNATPAFDRDTAHRWLELLHATSPGLLHICSAAPEGQRPNWTGRTFTEVPDALDYIERLDSMMHEGIYLRTTTLARPLRDAYSRGSINDSLALPGFAGDIDLAGIGHKHDPAKHGGLELPATVEDAYEIINDTGLPQPTIWVHSGGGVYPWWIFEEPVLLGEEEGRITVEAAQETSRRLQHLIKHAAEGYRWFYGAEVYDCARVMRIPGTVNRKEGGARQARILEPASYEFTSYADLAARVDELTARLPKPAAPPEPARPARTIDPAAGDLSPGDDFELRTSWWQILVPHGWQLLYTRGTTSYWRRPGKERGGHSATTGRDASRDRLYVMSAEAAPFPVGEPITKFHAHTLLNHGGDHSAAGKELRSLGYGSTNPAYGKGTDLTGLVRPVESRSGGAEVAKPAEQDKTVDVAPVGDVVTGVVDVKDGGRVRIDLGAEQDSITVLADAINARLIPDLYVRDGQLVHLSPKTTFEGEAISVTTVHADLLNLLLGRHAITCRRDKEGSPRKVSPSLSTLRAVLSSTFWPGVPVLQGIIGSPTLRPDGTLIQDKGYDKATGLYLQPTVRVERVPDRVSETDVAESKEFVFSKVFGEFCWSSVGDFANYLGLLVSPMLRPYIKTTTPFGMITATTRGSGKTNLSDAIGLLYGQSSQVWPGRSEELTKKVTAILAGDEAPVITFDNVMEGLSIRSEVLAGLVTKDVWSDRLLGHSTNVAMRNDRLWLATGNGLTVGGDMGSRTVLVRLDPRMERPELRTFEMGQFSDWIREADNRAALMYHLLVLVRAWMQEQAPRDESHVMRGFTRWAQIMGGFTRFHGLPGFLGNVDDLSSRDTDEEEWSSFLAKWHEIYDDSRRTTKELQASAQVDFIGGATLDRWARHFISDDDGRVPTPKKLAMMLHGKRDRFFGPYTLRSGRNNANVTVWWVECHKPTQGVLDL